MKVLDELGCFFAVIIGGHTLNELDFQLIIFSNKHFSSFDLIEIDQLHH